MKLVQDLRIFFKLILRESMREREREKQIKITTANKVKSSRIKYVYYILGKWANIRLFVGTRI